VQGDTLGRIASRFGTTVRAIADLNGIQDVNKIRIGQVLRLPGSGGNPTPSPAPRPAPTPSPNPQPQPQPQPRPNPGRATGADVIAYARQFIGCRYVFGGNGPLDQICGSGSKGVDCSGFVQQVYKHFGYNLSRVVKTQKYDGIAVASINEARAGDLIMHTNEYEGHIGFFTGNGLEYLHASSPSAGIKITSKWNHPAAITIIRRIIY
jgi:cell wall-associated NlpC family hydrolase